MSPTIAKTVVCWGQHHASRLKDVQQLSFATGEFWIKETHLSIFSSEPHSSLPPPLRTLWAAERVGSECVHECEGMGWGASKHELKPICVCMWMWMSLWVLGLFCILQGVAQNSLSIFTAVRWTLLTFCGLSYFCTQQTGLQGGKPRPCFLDIYWLV